MFTATMPPKPKTTVRPQQEGKEQKNLRLSPECRRLLALISYSDGIGESAVIELVVRREAKIRGIGGY